MSKKISESKLAFVTQCSTMETGLNSLPDTSLTVNNVVAPKTTWTQPLGEYVAAETDLIAKETAYHKAVAKAAVARVGAKEVVAQVTPYLKARFGPTNPQLQSQFAVKPDKEPVRKVAVKAAAAAKGAETRSRKKAAVAAAVAPAAATPPALPAAPTNGGNKPNGT